MNEGTIDHRVRLLPGGILINGPPRRNRSGSEEVFTPDKVAIPFAIERPAPDRRPSV